MDIFPICQIREKDEKLWHTNRAIHWEFRDHLMHGVTKTTHLTITVCPYNGLVNRYPGCGSGSGCFLVGPGK